MIEVTTEMIAAFDRGVDKQTGYLYRPQAEVVRAGLEAVLALMDQREQVGPCQVDLHPLFGGSVVLCELHHGHLGDHVGEGARWREHPEPAAKWRCNTTERCFQEDGHDGPHRFREAPTEREWKGCDIPEHQGCTPRECRWSPEQCDMAYEGWRCERPIGHTGRHRAGDGGVTTGATWTLGYHHSMATGSNPSEVDR